MRAFDLLDPRQESILMKRLTICGIFLEQLWQIVASVDTTHHDFFNSRCSYFDARLD